MARTPIFTDPQPYASVGELMARLKDFPPSTRLYLHREYDGVTLTKNSLGIRLQLGPLIKVRYKANPAATWDANGWTKIKEAGKNANGDICTVEHYVQACLAGFITSEDGHGSYVDAEGYFIENRIALPSEWRSIPKEATHVVWYNK
ncbi:hypothetical protein CCP3SC15_730004 [Gammaproteobacteria bacterium]